MCSRLTDFFHIYLIFLDSFFLNIFQLFKAIENIPLPSDLTYSGLFLFRTAVRFRRFGGARLSCSSSSGYTCCDAVCSPADVDAQVSTDAARLGVSWVGLTQHQPGHLHNVLTLPNLKHTNAPVTWGDYDQASAVWSLLNVQLETSFSFS